MDDNAGILIFSPTRTQHYLSRTEMIQGMANRFMYSEFYIYLYAGLAGLSIATLVLSAIEDCPSLLFYLLEILVNVAMITEVTIRFLALRKAFWKSFYNIIDIVLVVLCAITLIFVLQGCSSSRKEEEVFDTILLIVRNGVQFGRIAVMLRRNGKNIFGRLRTNRINFDDVRGPSFSMDIDLEAEEDEELQGAIPQHTDQAFLLADDNDEDEDQDELHPKPHS